MKNISISDKYSVSILKNCDKKVYFIHNILDNLNRKFQELPQDVICKDNFSIKNLEFG